MPQTQASSKEDTQDHPWDIFQPCICQGPSVHGDRQTDYTQWYVKFLKARYTGSDSAVLFQSIAENYLLMSHLKNHPCLTLSGCFALQAEGEGEGPLGGLAWAQGLSGRATRAVSVTHGCKREQTQVKVQPSHPSASAGCATGRGNQTPMCRAGFEQG